MRTPMLSHCLTLREVCVGVFGDFCSVLGLGAPFSLLYPTLLCAALFCLSEHRDSFFFVIVPADECLAISSSGGFETG